MDERERRMREMFDGSGRGINLGRLLAMRGMLGGDDMPDELREMLEARGGMPGSMGMVSISKGPNGIKIMAGGDLPKELKHKLMGGLGGLAGGDDDSPCFCPNCVSHGFTFAVSEKGAIQIGWEDKKTKDTTWTISMNGKNDGPKLHLVGEIPKLTLVTDLHADAQPAVMNLVQMTKRASAEKKRLQSLIEECGQTERSLRNAPAMLEHDIRETFPEIPTHAPTGELKIFERHPEPTKVDEARDVMPDTAEGENMVAENAEGDVAEADDMVADDTTEEKDMATDETPQPVYCCYGEELGDREKARALFTRQEELFQAQADLEKKKEEIEKIKAWLAHKQDHLMVLKREVARVITDHHPELLESEDGPSIANFQEGEDPAIVTVETVKQDVDVLPSDVQRLVSAMYALKPEMFTEDMRKALGL